MTSILDEIETLYFIRNRVGGVTSYVNAMVQNQSTCDHIHAFTMDGDLFEDLPEGMLHSDSYSRTDLTSLDNRVKKFKEMARIIPKAKIWIASNGIEINAFHYLKADLPLTFILHGDYDYYYNCALRYESLIDAFVCVSKGIYSRLLELLPDRSSDIHLIYYQCAVMDKGINRVGDKEVLDIIFVGRPTHEKGFFFLMEIDDSLRSREVQVNFHICIPDINESQRALLESRDNFKLYLGLKPDEVRNIHKISDIIILPSLKEGLPISVIEAMSDGVVPIVSDLPTLHELVDDNVGYRIDLQDIKGWTNAIFNLESDRTELKRKSEAAIQKSILMFDPKKNSEILQKVIQRAIKKPKYKTYTPVSYGSRLDSSYFPNPMTRIIRFIYAKVDKCFT